MQALFCIFFLVKKRKKSGARGLVSVASEKSGRSLSGAVVLKSGGRLVCDCLMRAGETAGQWGPASLEWVLLSEGLKA